MPLVVHPHLHRRRTGVTAHVESVVPALARLGDARVLESRLTGKVLAKALPRVGWREVWKRSRRSGAVWHAHRNIELLAGLLLRAIGARLKLVFTRHASHRPSLVTRFLLRRADRVVSLTRPIADAVGLPSMVVAHGVDLERFHPPADRDAAWRSLLAGGRYGVGVIGRVRPAKGQGDFARAFESVAPRFRDWQAVLVGACLAGDRAWANALATPRLALIGEQPDALPWYQGLTVLVQPSHAEGLSLAFLEGLAAGCCVVATRVSDFPSLIDHGRTGFLFAPGDVDGLAEILSLLLADPALAQRIGQAAAQEARTRFGVEREAAALSAIYRELAG